MINKWQLNMANYRKIFDKTRNINDTINRYNTVQLLLKLETKLISQFRKISNEADRSSQKWP